MPPDGAAVALGDCLFAVGGPPDGRALGAHDGPDGTVSGVRVVIDGEQGSTPLGCGAQSRDRVWQAQGQRRTGVWIFRRRSTGSGQAVPPVTTGQPFERALGAWFPSMHQPVGLVAKGMEERSGVKVVSSETTSPSR